MTNKYKAFQVRLAFALRAAYRTRRTVKVHPGVFVDPHRGHLCFGSERVPIVIGSFAFAVINSCDPISHLMEEFYR